MNWFVALPVEAPGLLEGLAPPPGVRLFVEADLHATIAFFGAVSEDAALAGWRALTTSLCARDLTLGPVIPLGPSALSATVDEPEIAALIAGARPGALRAAGARADDRPPLVHVTIARRARRASDAERRDAIAWAAALDLSGARARVDRIALYGWSSDRRTRLFRIADERPLAPRPAASEPRATQRGRP